MRAVLINDDKSLSLREVPDPVIKDDELFIKVMANGVNRADLLQREGNYPSPEGCPEWMGLEIAGTVEKIGSEAAKKSGFKVGDRVCALMGGGGYADFAAVKYDMVLPLPENFDFAQGACIPEVYCTAYLNLFQEAALQKGETLLVFAGASGVGIAATQIAKAMGAKVIVTVRSDEKAEKICKFGADVIVNTKKTDIEKVFEEHPVNVVLDCVAGEQLGKCFTKMARRGRWIMMNLPRRLDQKTLENLMRTLRRYNLARPVGRLTGLDSRIEVFPTVLLALPDADLADAAAESGRTRTELGLYERAEEAGEGEE